MHVNRKTLYLGVFLVATGGIVLVARERAGDLEFLTRIAGLWPLIPIALGLGLILRRTRLSLAGGMLAAATPGLLLGSMIVAGPRLDVGCSLDRPSTTTTRDGTFNGRASVDLDLACGHLDVNTGPGDAWRVRTADGGGTPPSIVARGDRLTVSSADRPDRLGFSWDADDWTVTLPTNVLVDLSTELSAGSGMLALGGATLGAVRIVLNAGDLRLDLGGSTVERIDLEMNAASVALTLPADDLSASLTVNAGELTICAPAELGLRIVQNGEFATTTFAGLIRSGDAWVTPGYDTAPFHADVTIEVNVGSVDIAPEGGCK